MTSVGRCDELPPGAVATSAVTLLHPRTRSFATCCLSALMRDESGTASSRCFNATPFSFSPPQITPLQRIKPLKHEQKKEGLYSILAFLFF